jgi:hypothetical protein
VSATSGRPTPKIVLLFRAVVAPRNLEISGFRTLRRQVAEICRCTTVAFSSIVALSLVITVTARSFHHGGATAPSFQRTGATPESASRCLVPPSTTLSPSLKTLPSPPRHPLITPIPDFISRSLPPCLALSASSSVGHLGALASRSLSSPSTTPELTPDTLSFHRHLPLQLTEVPRPPGCHHCLAPCWS